jgi:hypothetical protein
MISLFTKTKPDTNVIPPQNSKHKNFLVNVVDYTQKKLADHYEVITYK